MESAGRERGKGIRQRPAEDRKWQENAKKILNRGNELKDLLETQGLAFFTAKNELKTNSILSAKRGESRRKSGFCVAGLARSAGIRPGSTCGCWRKQPGFEGEAAEYLGGKALHPRAVGARFPGMHFAPYVGAPLGVPLGRASPAPTMDGWWWFRRAAPQAPFPRHERATKGG